MKSSKASQNNDLNKINRLFYKQANEDLIKDLPNLFVSLELFHEALYKKITKNVSKDPIRIKEIACGSRLGIWETFIKINTDRSWNVVLSEFSRSALPDLSTLANEDGFEFSTTVYDLFRDVPILKDRERFDIIFSTYTFDTLWFPQDMHLVKKYNRWYLTEFKINFPEKYCSDIDSGNKLQEEFFKNVKINETYSLINIYELEHGKIISEYYTDYSYVSIHYPGGLLDRINSFFDKQLKNEGLFITADIAVSAKSIPVKPYESVINKIKIKVEDYGLAKHILQKSGYNVELKSLYKFINDEGIKTPVEIYDHFVLLVKKK